MKLQCGVSQLWTATSVLSSSPPHATTEVESGQALDTLEAALTVDRQKLRSRMDRLRLPC